jgi:hypothetical protein
MIAGEVRELEIPASHFRTIWKIETSGIDRRAERWHVLVVFGEYRCTTRSTGVSLRGMLYTQPSSGARIVCTDFAVKNGRWLKPSTERGISGAHIEEEERFLAALGMTSIFSQLKKEQVKSCANKTFRM